MRNVCHLFTGQGGRKVGQIIARGDRSLPLIDNRRAGMAAVNDFE